MNDSRIAPVFQILAEDIHALGIRTVFGLMSDDTAVFAVTLNGLGVKFVGARHENNAIAMAEGYAYSTGALGVAIITVANGSREGRSAPGASPVPPGAPCLRGTGARAPHPAPPNRCL